MRSSTYYHANARIGDLNVTDMPGVRTAAPADAVECRYGLRAMWLSPTSPDPGERVLLASFAVSGKPLPTLVNDPEPRVRASIAWNPRVPFELLQILVEDPSPLVRASVGSAAGLHGKRFISEVLPRLLTDPVLYVRETAYMYADRVVRLDEMGFRTESRRMALKDRETLRTALREYRETAKSPWGDVRIPADAPVSAVSIPSKDGADYRFEYLSEHSHHASARSLIGKVTADGEVLRVLALDPAMNVRLAVATNKACPDDVRLALMIDPDDWVAVHAQLAAESLTLILTAYRLGPRDKFESLMYHMATRGGGLGFDLEDLEPIADEVADCWTPAVREAAAVHVMSELMLDRLVEDESTKVRVAVAGNPNLSERHLRMLAADEDQRVVTAAAAHPRMPADLLARTFKSMGPKDYKLAASYVVQPAFPLEERAEHAGESRSQAVKRAFMRSLTPEQAALLAGHENPKVRRMVSAHITKTVLDL